MPSNIGAWKTKAEIRSEPRAPANKQNFPSRETPSAYLQQSAERSDSSFSAALFQMRKRTSLAALAGPRLDSAEPRNFSRTFRPRRSAREHKSGELAERPFLGWIHGPLMRSLRFLTITVGALVSLSARADVALAPLFADHAVLQRDRPVPIWGTADVGEKVIVTFAGQSHAVTAAADGRWIVVLDARPASAIGADLVVTGKNTLTLKNIVIGDVWLCSGQSNMEFTVDSRPGTWQATSRVTGADAEIALARYPLIRHIRIGQSVAAAPSGTVATSGWQLTTPQTVGGFTAVGYFFARDLFQKLGVPIGLVHSSYSGTPVEAWMSQAALASSVEFARVSERWTEDLAAYAARKTQFDRDLAAWTAAEAAAKTLVAPTKKSGPKTPVLTPHAAFVQANPRPRMPRGFPSDPWQPAGLFNGMINPLLPYALRGALWYQGESNADRPAEYHALFTAMITAWRAHFGQADLPFFWVNLADFKRPADLTGRSWAFLREAQTRTLALANTGQALAIDLGDPHEIHPTNKQ